MKLPYFASSKRRGLEYYIVLDKAPGWANLFRRLWFSDHSKLWVGVGPVHKDNVAAINIEELPLNIRNSYPQLIKKLFEDTVWLARDYSK
jgi:hypothetical protein